MLKTSLHFTWRGLNHLTRFVLVGALLLALAGTGVVVGLRYWVMPDIERYHSRITDSATRAIGLPVSIGKIEADWRGIRPHLRLTDVRLLDQQGQAALELPHVDSVLSWMSLLTGELRLYSLEFDQPDLLVKRDAQGLLHIAGVPLSGHSSNNNLADWLSRQSSIVVRDARIVWQDELQVIPLTFKQVNLRIENGRGRHRFAVRALPPAELSTPLDVRGDFFGESFDDPHAWHGQMYTQLDYADVAAWRTWLPLPDVFKRGRGALRGWLEVAAGRVSRITADLVLADVQTQLGDDLPPLDMPALTGRVTWHDEVQGFEIATRQLSLRMNNGLTLQPTDFYLHLTNAQGGQITGGEIRANELDLSLLSSLTDYLPLESSWKQQLAELAPRGWVSNLQAKWQGGAGKLEHYEAKASFDKLSMKRTDKLPGFSGMSGEVNSSDSGGTLSLNAHELTLDAPLIMPEPLALDTLTAQIGWRTDKLGLEVKFSNVSAANDDAAGNAFGSFQTLPGSPGLLDLTVQLSRAEVNHAYRYIPLVALGKEANGWLRGALLDGQADEFRLRLRGNLKEFPFTESKDGIFQIQARARGVALQYAQGWPHIENAPAELLIQGKRMEVTAPAATTVGVHLQKISVVLPDITSPDSLLLVRGEAADATARGLDFIRKSPVRGYIGGFTDGATARGEGHLSLQVEVPLHGTVLPKVSGRYRFLNNEINLGNGIPILLDTNGELIFTGASVSTKDMVAEILGGPAKIAVQTSEDGSVHAKVTGHANLDAMRRTPPYPAVAYLHGGSDWQLEVTAQKQQTDVLVTSNLNGLISDLPAPFGKRADEIFPLRFEKKATGAQQDEISLQYGKLLDAKFSRRQEEGNWNIKRGMVNFGNSGRRLNREGIWVAGVVPQLSLQGWDTLFGSKKESKEGAEAISIAGADVLIQNLDAYGYTANDLRIKARNRNSVLTAQLAAKEINGEVSWQGQGKGKLVAHLKNLFLNKDENSKQESPTSKKTVTENAAGVAHPDLPELDLVIDNLALKGKPLGKLEVRAQPHEHDWSLESLRLINPDGVLTADGKWVTSGNASQTHVNLMLAISDAGKILGRSGYPNSVKNGSGKLECTFFWYGNPADFSYAKLDGSLKLETGKGQFLKIDPGMGKLLGILSLQALPQHITLDFTDVFSDGFAFDGITGTAQIKQGMLTTSDFRMDGSAAKVTMAGQVDLGHETQNLHVRIFPTVGNSVALLGAFAAGPAVGIGTYIVNKIFQDPLDKLVSFEYNVTGTWTDPHYEKVGGNKSAK